MKKYLYTFGYETPRQAKLNAQNGWDDEESEAVFIMAESAEQALSWGREISECFIKLLYKDPNISWKAMGFGHSIVEVFNVEDYYPQTETVNYGQYPELNHEEHEVEEL